ncbi:MAG TPA: glycosyltransferase, partial [Gemmatimonadaceae bacterium]|nr:glycosyltransferase [Gemmatimonadaceae bacterium]
MSTLREKAGALLFDWIPFELRLRRDWTRAHNRNERIDVDRHGVRCEWLWTSDLHIAEVFPSTGRRLMRAAFARWPIALADDVPAHDAPRVSFLIGHRGAERIPHLLTTIRSIAGQRGVPFECIVVEQSETIEARALLPAGVRYVHDAVAAGAPYNRSRAFNAGARAARGDVLILHDNDMVVPRD